MFPDFLSSYFDQHSLQTDTSYLQSKHYSSLPLQGLSQSCCFLSHDVRRINRLLIKHLSGRFFITCDLWHTSATRDFYLQHFSLWAWHRYNYTHSSISLLSALFVSITLPFKTNFQLGVSLPATATVNNHKHCHIHTVMIRHCFVQHPVNVSNLPALAMVIFTVWRHPDGLPSWLGCETNTCLGTREAVCCRGSLDLIQSSLSHQPLNTHCGH